MSEIQYRLKYLQPAQYESWTRKATDSDWTEQRYRTDADRAMVSAILELRDCIESLRQRDECIAALEAESAELERKGKDLCQAYGTSLITIAELKKQLARLSAPVTEAEASELAAEFHDGYGIRGTEAFLAARKGAAS